LIRIELSRDSAQHRLFDAWLAQAKPRIAKEVEVDLSKGVSIVFDGYGSLKLLEHWVTQPINCAQHGASLKDGRLLVMECNSAIRAQPAPTSHRQPWLERREIGSWVLAGDEDEEECGQIVAPAHRNERCYRVRFREGKERVIPAILLEPASPLEILGAQDDDPADRNPNLDF
jgi:hypothetical protein